MSRGLLRLLLLGLLLAAASIGARAQAVLALDADTAARPSLNLLPWLGYQVESRPGPAPEQPPADVLGAGGFLPATARALTPGYTDAAYWVRLQLHNPQPQSLQRVLLIEPARLESVSLYWRDAQGKGWQHSRAGTDQPFAARELPLRDHAFLLDLSPGEQRILWLRISSRSALALHASLWHEGALLQQQQGLLWFDGLLHSLGVVVGVIALLLALSQRSAGYALLGLYMAAATLFEASMRGTSFMLLWPQATDWALRALGSIGLFTTLMQALAVSQLLLLRQRQPVLQRLLMMLAGLNLSLIALCIWGDYRWATQAANYCNTGLMLLGLVASVRAARAGQFLGNIWLLVILSQILSLLPRQLSLQGYIPLSATLDYAGNIVSAAGGLLVLIAIVVRLNQERLSRAKNLEELVEQRTAALASAHAELRDKDAAKGRLLGYLGHDLRAPLASMLQLSRSLEPGPAFEGNRRAIEQGSVLLLDAIDELQGFARQPDASVNTEVLLAPAYLYGLLREAAEQAQAMIRSQGHQLRLQLHPKLPGVVELDARRVRQVLFNLLANSTKHGRPGGDIWLEAIAADGRLQITVQDQGPGIAIEEQALMFEPFLRSGRSAGVPGMGLGLSISRQTARAMGGDLTLISQPGEGCRFTLSLPLCLADERQVQWQPPRAGSVPALGEGLGAVVLDGCNTAAEALRERLLLAGFDVESSDSIEAVEPALAALAEHCQPRLLVYDPATLDQPQRVQALAALLQRWPALQPLACAARPVSEQMLAKPAADMLFWAAVRQHVGRGPTPA